VLSWFCVSFELSFGSFSVGSLGVKIGALIAPNQTI
jgi:hypothetical protein